MQTITPQTTAPHPLRSLFPITENWNYLNHAACSAQPQPVIDLVTRYISEQSSGGVESEMNWFPRIETAREKLAKLINATPDDLAWTQNTSVSISTIAQGLAWKQGDNVVATDSQFPANVVPWISLKQDGVETRLAERVGAGVPLDRIEALMDERTRVVAVSWVEFNSGYRYDLKALADLCHSKGALLVVDVIQALGALKLDVAATGVDFVCGAMHKWMMGPAGVGILYIRPGLLEELRPRFANWHSLANPMDNLNYDQPWIGNARRFEPSTLNNAGIIGSEAALDLIHEAGPDEIERRVLALAQDLINRLLEQGYDVVSPSDQAQSGVVCFHARGDEAPENVVTRLNAHKISVAARSGVVRIAPHFYNTHDEIAALFEKGLLG